MWDWALGAGQTRASFPACPESPVPALGPASVPWRAGWAFSQGLPVAGLAPSTTSSSHGRGSSLAGGFRSVLPRLLPGCHRGHQRPVPAGELVQDPAGECCCCCCCPGHCGALAAPPQGLLPFVSVPRHWDPVLGAQCCQSKCRCQGQFPWHGCPVGECWVPPGPDTGATAVLSSPAPGWGSGAITEMTPINSNCWKPV